jgi:signal transduction histidine kinase
VLETVNPADLIEQAIALCVEPGGGCGVALTRRIEWTGPALLDRNKVLQILVNLISNARNAVLESGRSDAAIEIALEPAGTDGEAIRFSVSDNGVGISGDDLPRLFAFGFSRRCDGHGFGLHSCANLARQMGATLTAHSDGLGQGARFCLEIPVVDKVQRVPK